MYFSVKVRNIPIFITDQIRRNFFASITKYNISKESRIMKKLIRKNEMNKDRNPALGINGAVKTGPPIPIQRRINVLNKIFMEYTTDFLSTGELDPRLLNKSLEIMYVKVAPDFKLINVYWIDNSIDTSDTEEILEQCAFKLRNELCQLHVIGIMPPIKFVKCKHLHKEREVERRLAIADYGEDYVPSIYPSSVNHVISTKKFANSNNETTKCESSDNSDDNFHITLPIMKHNIFDLDHAQIMSKIKFSLNQSKQTLLRRKENEQFKLSFTPESTPQKIPSFLAAKEQEDLFAKFLKDKRRERKIKYKEHLKKDNFKIDEYDFDNDLDNYDEIDTEIKR